MKPRKLRRLNFDSIQNEMSVIGEEHLRSIVGGYANDCFWRCIAYIESGGTDFSESAAAPYANSYFRSSGIDIDTRENGAAMTTEQMRDYINNVYNGSSDNSYTNNNTQHLLIQFNPSSANLPQYGNMSHVVIFKEYITDPNGNTLMRVFDPQHDTEYTIPLNSYLESFTVGYDTNGSSNTGSSNYGSSNYGSSNYGSSNYGSSNYGSSNYGSSNYGSSYY